MLHNIYSWLCGLADKIYSHKKNKIVIAMEMGLKLIFLSNWNFIFLRKN